MKGGACLDVEHTLVGESREEPCGVHAHERSSPSGTYLKSCCSTGSRSRGGETLRVETSDDDDVSESGAGGTRHAPTPHSGKISPSERTMNCTIAVSPSATGISHAATTKRSSQAASTSTALPTDTRDSLLMGTDDTVTRSELSFVVLVLDARTIPLGS